MKEPERQKTARVELKVRMKEALRAQIEAAAHEKGISLNAEAEARLERSFHEDWIIQRLLEAMKCEERLVSGDAMLETLR